MIALTLIFSGALDDMTFGPTSARLEAAPGMEGEGGAERGSRPRGPGGMRRSAPPIDTQEQP